MVQVVVPAVGRNARQQECEFIATDAGHDVSRTVFSQAAADDDEHLITNGMTERVVDRLEVVKVNDDRGGGQLLGISHQRGPPFVEGAPIEQPSQWIVQGGMTLHTQLLAESRHQGQCLVAAVPIPPRGPHTCHREGAGNESEGIHGHRSLSRCSGSGVHLIRAV
jgi:hypothetical protein